MVTMATCLKMQPAGECIKRLHQRNATKVNMSKACSYSVVCGWT